MGVYYIDGAPQYPRTKEPEIKTAKELAKYIKTLQRTKRCNRNGCEYFYLVPSILIQKIISQ